MLALTRLLATLFLIAIASAPAISQPGFQEDPNFYYQLSRLADRIQTQHPFEDSYYVGIGRSPSLVISLLEQAGASTTEIPFSVGQVQDLALSSRETAFFYYHYLAGFLPSLTQLGSKKLVLVDFAVSGDTITAALEVVADFYRRRYLAEVPVSAVVFYHQFTPSVDRKRVVTIPDHMPYFLDQSGDEWARFASSFQVTRADEYLARPIFRPSPSSPPPANYLWFIEQLRQNWTQIWAHHDRRKVAHPICVQILQLTSLQNHLF